MFYTKSFQRLLNIGLALFTCGCALVTSTSIPVLTASPSPLPPPTPTIVSIQNTPIAAKLIIGQPSSEDSARVVNLAFSPDGSILISQTGSGAITLWNADTGHPIDQLTDQGYFAEGFALSPDGKLLASGSCGKHESGLPGCDRYEIILWDMATRQPVGQPLESHFAGTTTPEVLFSPDGKILAAMQSGLTGSGFVRLFDISSRQPLSPTPLGDQEQFSSMAFSPDSKLMALGSVAGIIYLWSPEMHQILFHIVAQKAFVRSVAFSPDGKTLAAALSGPTDVHCIQLWDMDTEQPIGQPFTVQTATGTPVGLTDLAISPDGKILAVLDENGAITLWDLTTDHQIGSSFTGQSGTTSLTFRPDDVLASGNKDGTITLWDNITSP